MCLMSCFFPNDVSPINIFFLNILLITLTMVFSVLLTIFFNGIIIHVFKHATRSTVLLSYALFWVVLSIMLQDSLSSISLLKMFYWYLTPGIWTMALTTVRIWLGAGYLSIIYLAEITSIPEDTYEVARIDGISTTRISWQIIRPLLFPTAIILLLVVSVRALAILA